jgi:hypothetical protein
MKKSSFKSRICDKIIGPSVCRLGNDKKDEAEVWECNECYYRMCFACMKIRKYLKMIENLRLS